MTNLTQEQLDQLYLEWSGLGAQKERKRIIKILKEIPVDFNMNDYSVRTIAVAIERIEDA